LRAFHSITSRSDEYMKTQLLRRSWIPRRAALVRW